MLHSEDFASLLDAAKKNIEEGMMLMLRVRARNGKGKPTKRNCILKIYFWMPRL
jgi:hypothetical protein